MPTGPRRPPSSVSRIALLEGGGLSQEALARLDVWVGSLMSDTKTLGIAENTLVILMADNGPMTHDGPPAWPRSPLPRRQG